MLREAPDATLMIKSARVRVLLLIVGGLTATITGVWLVQNRFGYGGNAGTLPARDVKPAVTPVVVTAPTPPQPENPASATALATPDELPENQPSPTPSSLVVTLDPSYVGRLNLAVPVKGVKAEQLQDTFKDARSEGRVHDAIDIPAPAGTPVIATAEGEIIKLFESERGGTTIYQASKDKKLIFYYAHLQRYAEGLVVGKTVWQGETIGYVGDTGNAGAENYHLHFSIMIVSDPKRYWEGTNINPYPLLRK
ncbi:MAG TPA: peptidoglycan DD-metalloendopeptidase family protein [Pyrinomonadaceae bacterium]|nr:peptidoglycan DD-metalloendopeptidase family protein [Pyrinomonadaceae bacterium]